MTAIEHDLRVAKPDYAGGSIVNLMASFGSVLGAAPPAYAPLAVLPADRLGEAKRIALVVIDGMGDELLAHLGGNGAFAAGRTARMTSVYPPTTASAITTFMTGLAPQQHGLTGWFMHFRKLGAVTAVLPYVPRYTQTPISKAGIGVADLAGCPSFFDQIDAPSCALMPAPIADSDFSRHFCGAAERVPYTSLGDFTDRLNRYCAGESGAARYLYAYWSKLDHLAHVHGPSSAEVSAHFHELDEAVGDIAARCADSGTLLVVTADHGFLDTGAEERVDLEDHPRLADMLSLPLAGEPRSAYCYVQHRHAAAFEDYVESELGRFATVVASEQLVDDGWFGPGQPHPELYARIGDFTLQMRDRYTIRDCVLGESGFDLKGMHGGVSAAEQYVPLILAGP